jgi:hypothetical protein
VARLELSSPGYAVDLHALNRASKAISQLTEHSMKLGRCDASLGTGEQIDEDTVMCAYSEPRKSDTSRVNGLDGAEPAKQGERGEPIRESISCGRFECAEILADDRRADRFEGHLLLEQGAAKWSARGEEVSLCELRTGLLRVVVSHLRLPIQSSEANKPSTCTCKMFSCRR